MASTLKSYHLSICPEDVRICFYNDMISLFLGTKSGHVGKYCYDEKNWNAVIKTSQEYYVPQADNELIQQSAKCLQAFIPSGMPYVDFGIGGQLAFQNHVLPMVRTLKCSCYIGVDFCPNILNEVPALLTTAGISIPVKTVFMDFFIPMKQALTSEPSLGVMNGLTVTNQYGTLQDTAADDIFTKTLSQLSNLVNNGWLLLTIDTNQDEQSLKNAYETPMTSRLYLNVFQRMAKELPVSGFNPLLFTYDPEWHPEIHLFAHVARATEAQDFMLGSTKFHVRKGDKYHLLNSYKTQLPFFEACAIRAGMTVKKVWHHDQTPMKLCLLVGKNAKS